MPMITAMVGELKDPLSLDDIEGILDDYREVQRRFVGGDQRDFIKEATEVHRDHHSVRFKFRWDDVHIWQEDNETREAKQTFRCAASCKTSQGRTYVFIYAQTTEAGSAIARLSEALFRKLRQIRRVIPTPELFNWILQEELTSAKHGAFKIVRLPGTEHASVSGSFDPDQNPYWRTYRRDGVVTSLRYEHSGRRREYSISSTAMYSVDGDGVTQEELEQYVLDVLVPNL